METFNTSSEIDLYLESQIEKTSLDRLCTFSFNFEQLKYVLDLLIRQQRDHSKHIKNIYNKVNHIDRLKSESNQYNDSISDLRKKIDTQKEQISKIHNDMRNMKHNIDKSNEVYQNKEQEKDSQVERIQQLQENLLEKKESLQKEIQDFKQQQKDIQQQCVQKHEFQELKNEINNLALETVKDKESQLQKQEDKIQELEYENNDYKQVLNTFQDQISKLEEKLGSQNNKIENFQEQFEEKDTTKEDEINKVVKFVNQLQQQLQDKVGFGNFEKEVNKIREAIENIQAEQNEEQHELVQSFVNDAFQNKHEFNMLKEIGEIMPILEERVQMVTDAQIRIPKLESQLKYINQQIEDIQNRDLQQEVNELYQIKLDKSSLQSVTSKLDNLENKIKDIKDTPLPKFLTHASTESISQQDIANLVLPIERRLQDAEHEIKKFNKKPSNIVQVSQQADEQQKDTLTNLKSNFEHFKVQQMKTNKEIDKSIKLKVGYQNLTEVEKFLMEQLNAQINKMLDKIEDTKQLKNRSVKLENMIKGIINYLNDQPQQQEFIQNQQKEEEGDVMFAKKPLGGWSCASCDRDVNNLNGRIGEYQVWNQFPSRETPERISQIGQGFSRMLKNIKPEFYEKVKTINEQKSEADNTNQTQSQKYLKFTHPRNKSAIKSQLSKTQPNFFQKQDGAMTERTRYTQEQSPRNTRIQSEERVRIPQQRKNIQLSDKNYEQVQYYLDAQDDNEQASEQSFKSKLPSLSGSKQSQK